ncbi:unnamed protein product, partial [Citrullus colocynthis]
LRHHYCFFTWVELTAAAILFVQQRSAGSFSAATGLPPGSTFIRRQPLTSLLFAVAAAATPPQFGW